MCKGLVTPVWIRIITYIGPRINFISSTTVSTNGLMLYIKKQVFDKHKMSIITLITNEHVVFDNNLTT